MHFYDTGTCAFNGFGLECAGRLGVSPRRIAMFLTPADEFGFSNLIWVDLTTGDVSGPAFDFENGIGFIHVSPSGTQAFLQHDLELTTEADYRLIDLCPGTLGTVINPGGFPITNSPEVLSAEVCSQHDAARSRVEVKNQSGVVRDTATFADCLDATGACCYANGGCFDTGTTEAAAVATFLGAGTACSECPPPVEEVPCCIRRSGSRLLARRRDVVHRSRRHVAPRGAVLRLRSVPAARSGARRSSAPRAGAWATSSTINSPTRTRVASSPEASWSKCRCRTACDDVAVANGGEFDTSSNAIRWTIGDLAPGASGGVLLVPARLRQTPTCTCRDP